MQERSPKHDSRAAEPLPPPGQPPADIPSKVPEGSEQTLKEDAIPVPAAVKEAACMSPQEQLLEAEEAKAKEKKFGRQKC